MRRGAGVEGFINVCGVDASGPTLRLSESRPADARLNQDCLRLRPATVLRSHVSLAVSAPRARAAGRLDHGRPPNPAQSHTAALNIFTDADGQHIFALCKQRGRSKFYTELRQCLPKTWHWAEARRER